jgi:glycosyltransferase involved in cell wall biosynthesis
MNIVLSLEDLHLGGGPRFALELGSALASRGHHITIVAQQRGPWWPELARRGLHGWLQPTPLGASRAGQARRLAHYLNHNGTDAILINVSGLNVAAQSALHLVDDRIAVIPVLHGDWPELYTLTGRLAPLWNAAVGVGPAVQRGLAQRFPDRPTFGITNGVPIPDDREIRIRADWTTPLRLLFAGRLVDSHKGILRLPQILAACRARGLPVQLTVVGDGPDRSRLEHAFAGAGVHDSVRMRGALSQGDTAAAMLEHHVLLLTSNTDGLPLVMLEAMAAGCVVVASHLPGITDAAIDDDVHGRLTAPNDIPRWVDHIAEMLVPATWRRLSAAAAARTRARFSVEAMTDRYEAILRDAVAGALPLPHSRRAFPSPFGLRDRIPHAIARRISEPVFRLSRRMRALVTTSSSYSADPQNAHIPRSASAAAQPDDQNF